MKQADIIGFIKENKLYDNCTNNIELSKLSENQQLTFYIGIDLTGLGLHVGHYANLMLLRKLIKLGHKALIILGGATTYIGDPSGKEKMRKILSEEQIKLNKKSIAEDIINVIYDDKEIQKININYDKEIVWEDDNVKILDNYHWLFNQKYILFLRDVGSYFTINQLLSCETVKSRLEKQEPFSFLEFNYPLLQAFDFYYLSKNYNCDVQIGGSDQWVNIIQGIHLINKMLPEKKAYGLTIPLITRSDGKKMGKTENGAVWLKEEMLSNLEFFQYFRNLPDENIHDFLYIFTELSKDKIKEIRNENINKQKEILAYETMLICRNKQAAEEGLKITNELFRNPNKKPSNAINCESNQMIIDLIIEANLSTSRSEAKRLFKSKAIYINSVNIANPFMKINKENLDEIGIKESFFILSCGKKKKMAFNLID